MATGVLWVQPRLVQPVEEGANRARETNFLANPQGLRSAPYAVGLRLQTLAVLLEESMAKWRKIVQRLTVREPVLLWK